LTSPPATANQILPVVTANGSGFTATWIEPVQSRNTIVSQVASAGGDPIEGAGAAFDQGYVQSMSIAHGPFDSLLVGIAGLNAYAEPLSPSGRPLTQTSIKDFPLDDVAMAWNGSSYFVVLSNGSQLEGTG
jgi:hypothetical protein